MPPPPTLFPQTNQLHRLKASIDEQGITIRNKENKYWARIFEQDSESFRLAKEELKLMGWTCHPRTGQLEPPPGWNDPGKLKRFQRKSRVSGKMFD